MKRELTRLYNILEAETGYRLLLTDGFRTYPEQVLAAANGGAPPGTSMHEVGYAIDFNVLFTDGQGITHHYKKFGPGRQHYANVASYWIALFPNGTLQTSSGLRTARWGGDFDDRVHIDLYIPNSTIQPSPPQAGPPVTPTPTPEVIVQTEPPISNRTGLFNKAIKPAITDCAGTPPIKGPPRIQQIPQTLPGGLPGFTP